jgi:ABC-type polysaccharide/polyol phosphate transport system ATPase subunit
MRARLGFSIATAVRPDILLIDEVFAVGDVEFKERSKERILEIVRDAGTVVIVSHNFSLLEKTCTRLLLIEDGKLHTSGDPKEVLKAQKRTRGTRTKKKAS